MKTKNQLCLHSIYLHSWWILTKFANRNVIVSLDFGNLDFLKNIFYLLFKC